MIKVIIGISINCLWEIFMLKFNFQKNEIASGKKSILRDRFIFYFPFVLILVYNRLVLYGGSALSFVVL